MMSPSEVVELASCLNGLPAVPQGPARLLTLPEKVLDCVLSLNRRYDEFAAPRVNAFHKRHPKVVTLIDLCKCVAATGGPIMFYRDELDYDYPDAAEMFGRVLDYLVNEIKKFPGKDETERCRGWAVCVPVDGYRHMWKGTRLPLYGIAGWQYLRMLLGADTCKPDLAVNSFVAQCLGHKCRPRVVVELIENAARITPSLASFAQPVREADRRVWHRYNQGKKQSRHGH